MEAHFRISGAETQEAVKNSDKHLIDTPANGSPLQRAPQAAAKTTAPP